MESGSTITISKLLDFAPFVLKIELSVLVPGREIDNRKVHY